METLGGSLLDVFKESNQSLDAFKDCFNANGTQRNDEKDQIDVYHKLINIDKCVSPIKLFDFLSEKKMMVKFLLSLDDKQLESYYDEELYSKLEAIYD